MLYSVMWTSQVVAALKALEQGGMSDSPQGGVACPNAVQQAILLWQCSFESCVTTLQYHNISLAGFVKGTHFQALTCFLPSLALGCL